VGIFFLIGIGIGKIVRFKKSMSSNEDFLEEIALPDSLQVIGSCAFYNCRSLRLLTVGSGSLTVGSDVFLNCFALETIRVQAAPGDSTGLFALVKAKKTMSG